MRSLYLDVKPFKAYCLFVWDCTPTELVNHLHKKYDVEKDEKLIEHLSTADGTALTLDGEPYRVVWLRKFKRTPYYYGVLSHEISHMVIRLLEWKGMPYSSHNNEDEVLAYLMDYFTVEFLEHEKKK